MSLLHKGVIANYKNSIVGKQQINIEPKKVSKPYRFDFVISNYTWKIKIFPISSLSLQHVQCIKMARKALAFAARQKDILLFFYLCVLVSPNFQTSANSSDHNKPEKERLQFWYVFMTANAAKIIFSFKESSTTTLKHIVTIL